MIRGSPRALCLALLVVCATVSPAILGVAPAVGTALAQEETPTPTNNSSLRHEDPAELNKSGDLQRLQGWLAGRMGTVVIDCTQGVQVGNYDACEQMDEDYPDWLDKYVDVAGDTQTERDDNATDAFEETRQQQQNLSNDVQEFRETKDEYEQARESGDVYRARQLARELNRLAQDVNSTSDDLIRNYGTISNNTDVNLNESATTVDSIRTNVTDTADEVQVEQFTNTTLTVEAADEQISFLDPLDATGRLTTEDGEALADQTVRFQIGGQTVETTTDGNGEFALTYRPTTLALDTSEVTLRYVPNNTSLYWGSQASLPVDVEQVNSEMTVSREPESVAFGDNLSVRGSVAVEETGAPNVPVVVSVDGVPVGRTQTDGEGNYELEAALPADIEDGNQTVRASLPLTEQALASSEATAPITVTTTNTTLSVSGEQAGPRAVRASGVLRTADGRPVANQSVELRVNGTTVGEAVTDGSGRYMKTVNAPGVAEENATVALVARFDGQGTNLEASAAEDEVALVAGGSSGGAGGPVQNLFGNTTDAVLDLVGFLALVLVVVLVYHRDRVFAFVRDLRSGDGDSESAAGEDAAVAVAADVDDSEPVEPAEPTPEPLTVAQEQLDAGETDHAAMTAYSLARTRLAEKLHIDSPRTHWEFFVASRDQLGEAEGRLLQHLTEAYEQASFAADTLPASVAKQALSAAAELTESRQESRAD
ncbi:hypothetical protein ACFQH3_19050 [Haladaptatus sp. GCM10025707]|uniref:hypothetical protein n=1 Tax=unclassified Haladaptatus TaxID=2622732 RepID=UPI0023E7A032|nr:hypothetical protein [Haladaptatus sp. QDMS2]